MKNRRHTLSSLHRHFLDRNLRVRGLRFATMKRGRHLPECEFNSTIEFLCNPVSAALRGDQGCCPRNPGGLLAGAFLFMMGRQSDVGMVEPVLGCMQEAE